MNWINEMLAFERQLEIDPLPPLAQLLWYKLMAQNNKSLWSEWFIVDNCHLMVMLGSCSEKTAITARNQLLEAGRIEYRKGKKGSPNKYHMIPFDCKYSSINGSTKGGIIPVQTEVQRADIYKLKQEILNFSFADDDLQDSKLARASAGGMESSGNGGKPFLPLLDEYAGITDAQKSEAAALADRLYRRYFGMSATEQDIYALFEHIRHGQQQDGVWTQSINTNRVGVVEYAFRVAAENGVRNWLYVKGVLSKLAARGLKTLDACEIHDAQRDYDKDNRR